MQTRSRRTTAAKAVAKRLEPQIKLWVEKDGELALSDYRVQLLAHIAQTGSLAAAAERMGLSYRRAWGKIREIEGNLGLKLVESEQGGVGGGHSRLTADGERLLEAYSRFRKKMERDLGKEFRETFIA